MTARAKVAIGCCLACLALGAIASGASADPSEYGFESATATLSTTQAGGHPDLTVGFTLKQDPATKAGANGFREPYARTRDLSVALPAAMVGNPTAVTQCTIAEFQQSFNGGGCPQSSQVGLAIVKLYDTLQTYTEPIYNVKPSGDDVAARLAFYAQTVPVYANARVRSEGDYGITTTAEGIFQSQIVVSSTLKIWGVPASPAHDTQRLTPREALNGKSSSPPRPPGLAPVPFLSNPPRCGVEQKVEFAADSYQIPGQFASMAAPLPAMTGCESLVFSPSILLSPTTGSADSPSGIDATLSVPQEGLANPEMLASPHLKKAVVTLPDGFALNPSAAAGLEGCTEDEIGVTSVSPEIHFDVAPPACPEASKVGNAEIETPLLAEPLSGALYLATQSANPFNSLLAGYLYAHGQGVTIKVAGRFSVDQSTGQITAIFDQNPQQPFNRLLLRFKSGSRGVLTTPSTCGQYTINSSFTPWSAENPENPSPSDVINTTQNVQISSGPGGSSCPSGALNPSFEAGTTGTAAGQYKPFVLRLGRDDGTGRFSGLNVTLPEGLVGKLAGIPYCSDAALGGVPTAEGTGSAQLANPSCPSASQVGTVSVGAGSGPEPLHVNTGKVYLAGPYKGAPLSLAIVTPAVAGPFDLGNVVVRAAVRLNLRTTQITAESDPLPTILDGIPLDLREIRLNMNRPEFTLNPTSCNPKTVSGLLTSTSGQSAAISNRFQAEGCSNLGFKPQLKLRLSGATKRSGHPALKAVVTYPQQGAYANIAKAQVGLPHSEFLDQGNLDKVCTQPELNSNSCPQKSIYGHVKAWTPLLEKPLEGPVYLGVGFGYKLPALVADLNGQVRILLVGKVDTTKQHGIRNTFEAVPDAPVSRFTLELKGGNKYGLLENSEDICSKAQRASVVFTAQNGLAEHFMPQIANSCGKKGKKHPKSRGGKAKG